MVGFMIPLVVGLVVVVPILWWMVAPDEARRFGHGPRLVVVIAILAPITLLAARSGIGAFPVRVLALVGKGAWEGVWVLVALAILAAVFATRVGIRTSAPREVRAILVRRGMLVAGLGLAVGLGAHAFIRRPPPIVDFTVLALIGLGGLAALRASLTTPMDPDGPEDPAGSGTPGPPDRR